jgi:hypothetical protein
MKRRVRPTLLLRTVIVAVSLAIFVAVMVALPRLRLNLLFTLDLLLLWFVALELEVLPLLLERAATRWAEEHSGPPRSLWFVDLAAEDAAERDGERTAVRSNPALW